MRSLIRRRAENAPAALEALWPFRDMWDAMGRMEKSFADIFGDKVPAMAGEGMAGPAIDLYKEGESYVIEAAIPGVKKEDFQIHAAEDAITISGEHKDERKIEEKNMYWKEIRRGSFQRTITFQEPIKSGEVKASYKDGILKVTLPLEAPKKSEQIKVNIE
ncbi:MAG: Hsp20/alpha crystallin family protein [Candidatus Eremiobacteraeota bacterium]|nr:Hsp20/alpha crystallin family protein [Candidatus Eremiobacteraeota bacterium]